MPPRISSGKRQARRIRAVERLLQSGELTPEDIPDQYGLEGYSVDPDTLTLRPPPSDALAAPDPEPVVAAPEPEVAPSQPWAPSVGSLDLPAPTKRPRVSFQEPSSSSSSGPRPVESSEASAPSGSTGAPDPFQGISVSFDLHRTIDDSTWAGSIPSVHRTLLRRLVSKGVPLLICSYIGRSLGEGEEKERRSQDTRDNARAVVSHLAADLGLTYTESLEQGLHPDCLTFVIVDRKLWKAGRAVHGPLNGKVSCLTHFGVTAHFDDNLEINSEIAKYGFLPYHHLTGGKQGRKRLYLEALDDAGFSHYSSSSFVESFKAFVSDVESGIFWRKHEVLQDSTLPFSL